MITITDFIYMIIIILSQPNVTYSSESLIFLLFCFPLNVVIVFQSIKINEIAKWQLLLPKRTQTYIIHIFRGQGGGGGRGGVAGLVQWLKLPAWKVGDRGLEPRSGIQVSKKQNVSSQLTIEVIILILILVKI